MTNIPTTTAAVTISSLPSTEDYIQLHETNTQESVSPESPASVSVSVSTKHSSSSKRSIRKSFSYSKRNNRKLIVFASGSKYQWLVALLVVAPLFAILMSIILFDVHSQDEYKNSSTIWALGWCFIFIMVTYMAILPRQVDVRSNGTVAIKTCLLTFFIDEIARAYRGGNIESNYNYQNLLRPRVMLATSLDKDGAVVIRRNHGKWDVLVTPEDPEGFVNAVEEMVRKKENEDMNSDSNKFVVAVTSTGQQQEGEKPNLACTTLAPTV